MPLILPDPRWETMELLYPQRKPVGRVVASDKCLWDSYALLDGVTNYDLKTKAKLVSSPTVQRLTTGGLAHNFARANTKLDIDLDVTGGAFSVVVAGLYDDIASAHTITGTHSASASGGVQFRMSNSGLLELIKQNVSVIVQPAHAAIAVGEVFVAGLTFDNAASYALYLNGKKLASGTPVSCSVSELYMAYRNGSTTEQWSGAALVVMAKAGILSDSEMISATANPYQFLIAA